MVADASSMKAPLSDEANLLKKPNVERGQVAHCAIDADAEIRHCCRRELDFPWYEDQSWGHEQVERLFPIGKGDNCGD